MFFSPELAFVNIAVIVINPGYVTANCNNHNLWQKSCEAIEFHLHMLTKEIPKIKNMH
jgi:hypothetical protein